MIIIMKPRATEAQQNSVIAEVEKQGFVSHPIFGEHLTVVAVVGPHPGALREYFESLDGVDRVQLIESSYKLVSRAGRDRLQFHVGENIVLGGDELVVMAGPCAVENEEMILASARAAKQAGAKFLRGGAFKPRTSPYAFMGLGEEGLQLLAKAREETGLAVISEVTDPRLVELCAQYCDMLQIGARNMQNFVLLSEAGKAGRPVMLKRGMSATVEDLLNAAEYIAAQGEERILLCERGIRTYETSTRNTLDINAVPVLRKRTHLPICVDPSHACGDRGLVPPLACAAVAVGADALMVEIHPNPTTALSDGAQSLTFEGFAQLMQQLRRVPRYDYPTDCPATAE